MYFQDTVVSDVQHLCEDVKLIEILYPISLPAFDPGSHVDLRVYVDGRAEIRSYSVVEQKADKSLSIAVRKLPQGRGGSLYMHCLEVGQRLEACLPSNHFTLGFDASETLLLAGGIGITPLIGMARTLQRLGKRFRFVYLGRSRSTMPFLSLLTSELGGAMQVFADDEDGPADLVELISTLPADAHTYMCGPGPMMEVIRDIWAGAKRPREQLRFETFGSVGSRPAESFRVKIPAQGLDIQVPANRTLLDVLEEAGAEPLYSCRRGECGLCAVDVLELEGDIDHRDVFFSEHQRSENKHLCACVSRVIGNITVEMP